MDTLILRPHLRKGPVFVREIQGVALVLTPHGPLGNLHETEIVQETTEILEFVNHSSPTNLVIDLQQGDYAGSAFIGAVIRLWKRVGQNGGRLALCHVSENVIQVLRASKLHTTWPIYISRDEAVRAVGGL